MIEEALERLRNGEMILLHDSSGRENEVDMVVAAQYITPDIINTMRSSGGGLICLAVSRDFAKKLHLPYLTELMIHGNEVVKKLIPERTAYGDKPAFSLSVNHRETYTGITDNDRAHTISEFTKLENPKQFVEGFYAPGHVHLLIAKSISERRGHTELSIELSKKAGITEAMVLCEMMGADHNALSIEDARRFAEDNNLAFVDGGEI